MKLEINIKDLISGESSYPSWATNSEYSLHFDKSSSEVWYKTKNRRVSRIFPETINLTAHSCYIFGLIKGEGANSKGKSNYRRFTFTNGDPKVILLVLEELRRLCLVKDIPDEALHLLHFTKAENPVIDFWSKSLNLPRSKFKCFNDKNKTSPNGVCHLYLSDVLLRRVTDLVQKKLELL